MSREAPSKWMLHPELLRCTQPRLVALLRLPLPPFALPPPPETHKPQRVQGWAVGPLPLFAGSVQAGVFFGSSREGCSILSSILITDPRGLLGMFLSRTLPLSRRCCRDVGETTASRGAGTAWRQWGEHSQPCRTTQRVPDTAVTPCPCANLPKDGAVGALQG